MKLIVSLLAVLAGAFSVAAGYGYGTIVDVAVANDFTILVAALKSTGLDEALMGDGPFTVFAPTDEAFGAVEGAFPGLLSCLLEENDVLTSILLYHVLSGKVLSTDPVDGMMATGKVLSTDLVDGMMATTLNGEDITVDLSSGVMINDANVILADVPADNGVVHVIDSVLLPPSVVAVLGDFYASCPPPMPPKMGGKKGKGGKKGGKKGKKGGDYDGDYDG
eukprot:CAMPEP_0168755270 /NCGR_PEP_ID=MMETSP0724-20121128/19974_1 /TAXON_ID=265536 /ORGANISM="Amphiprora sp., Strain CCMP467" /LENGTH=220 /DNA_ID=CAMNT_0008803863 /DNA_START=75 /DNA_END=733 /DNA_ORIENTATION=+